jgi:hypothetical protein
MVNLLRCDASLWTGEGGACKWCGTSDTYATLGKGFCSKGCMAAFWNNHQYTRGKVVVLAWNSICRCDEVIEAYRYDYFVMQYQLITLEPPHVVCAGCGECEAQILNRGDRLTVNHIKPRYGIPTNQINCIHHIDNLEPLCWRCHEMLNRLEQDREAWLQWTARVRRGRL